MLYALKVQKKAASSGFDWPDVDAAFAKIVEETVELELGELPTLTEAEASQPALQQLFANRRDNADSEQQARAHEARWAKQVDARLDQAARLLGVRA